MIGREGKSLAQRIADFEYHPEIYTYPTPRMYRPLEHFTPHGLEWTPEVNVYLHVPFCKQFCSFCGYFKTIDKESQRADFVEAVVGEIALRADALQGKTVKTLHFGGGTPSLLDPNQLRRLVQALQTVNPEVLCTAVEVSIEATPESVERTKFAAYREAGINRVSLGVQSLVDAEVVLANRGLNPERSALDSLTEAVGTLREVGVRDVVIDLMIGIEEQTIESFEATIRAALTLRPETVQLYALGLMPQTGLARRKPNRMMTGEQIYQCYEIGRHLFLEAGYRQDSHDRYTLHPHNGFLQGDWNIRGMSLVGFGAGARSYTKTLHFRNTYASLNGHKALEIYMENIRQGRLSVESGVELNLDEQMRQYAIGHIQALDDTEFEARFGIRFVDQFSQIHREMVEQELVIRDGSILKLTPKGLLFRDLLGRQLFSSLANQRENAYRPC